MNKKYIVEDIVLIQNSKLMKRSKISEWKSGIMQRVRIWDIEGKTEDERESTTLLIRCRTTWEFILHLFSTVTTDPTR